MKRANSLVGLLVTIAIIAILAVVFMKGSSIFGGAAVSNRPDGKGKTIPGLAMARARDTQCRSDLGQLRIWIGMRHDDDPDGGYPATLEESKFGKEFYSCPLGKEPYQYDPQTGTVKCVHPGHEKY